MPKNIIKVSCLKHQYPDKTEVSVCGLDFLVAEGQKVALIGANGSGKTTLLNHLLGLLKPTKGQVEVLAVDPVRKFSEIGRKIGVVVQNVEDQLIGPTVFDDIAFSPRNYGLNQINERVEKIIEELKIKHLQEKIVHYLSGGEKKKVALAGALVLEPKLLILDETLAELDTASVNLILKKFKRMSGMAVVMATNDLELLEKFADLIYLLEDGNIVFKGTYPELKRSNKKCQVCQH